MQALAGEGSVRFNKDGSVDQRCAAVRQGDLRVRSDGLWKKNCATVCLLSHSVWVVQEVLMDGARCSTAVQRLRQLLLLCI